jgi:hypothetical protein
MAKNKASQGKRTMDPETARVFAFEEFEKRRPQCTWPEWLERCTVDGCGSRYGDSRLRVTFAVTPKATRRPISYFEAEVDPQTSQVTVLIDRDPSEFLGEELLGFHPLEKNPWLMRQNGE